MADDPPRDPRLRGIGERIRKRRNELGRTQDELRDSCGVSKSFISEVENGAAAANGLIYLRIAEALETDIGWLLTGKLPERVLLAVDPEIRPIVEQIAYEENWSARRAVEVADALSAVVARRTTGGVAWRPTREEVMAVGQALAGGDDDRDG